MNYFGYNPRGTIVPIVRSVDGVLDPKDLFVRISDYGRRPYSIFLESTDIVPKYGELSLGTGEPCLRVRGIGYRFEINALNQTGERFIKSLKGSFDFAEDVNYGAVEITGTLKPQRGNVSEDERLHLKTHADVIRGVAFHFTPTQRPSIRTYAGLFGGISYDFIDQYEDLPAPKDDLLHDPDYEMYFVDHLFLVDHKQQQTHFIANALLTGENDVAELARAEENIRRLETALDGEKPKAKIFNPKKGSVTTDTTQEEYEQTVRVMKEHVYAGDVFQVVPARKIIADYNAEPLDIYSQLRTLNPSPYMFYINNGSDGILLGASPEMALRVFDGVIEIRPIAGTRPRGMIDDRINGDLDYRLAQELRTDEKELAEHMMLVDLARNDVAKVSKPGTRVVDELCIVEKYSHVQHLVSNVKGVLKDGLDCLHAYVATMNMGTLTGAPKVMAMRLIRKYERSKRGYYGGAVGYITPSGDMDTALVIRSMELKGSKAYVQAGAGIVYDSDPTSEFKETEQKVRAPLLALQRSGGIHD